MIDIFRAAGTRSAWAGALLLLAACGPMDPGEVANPSESRSRIINGTLDTTDRSAAMLFVAQPDGSGYLCSGSIIGPHTFLTAGHCTNDFQDGGIAVINNATDAIDAIFTDGGYWHVDNLTPYPGYKGNVGNRDWHDLGLIHVVEAMPGPYLPVNRYPLERLVITGLPVREVGYGITHADAGGDPNEGSGTRRDVVKRDMMVIDSGELQGGAKPGLTCSGDSGGPALFMTPDKVWTVIGITSRGDPTCAVSEVDTRPDPYLSWIATYMANHGDSPSCDADGRCGFGCAAPDPDCPCAPDGFCTDACPDKTADPDCTESCLFDGGTCIPPPPAMPAPAKPTPPPAPQHTGCTSVDGAALWPLLALALLGARRRRGVRA